VEVHKTRPGKANIKARDNAVPCGTGRLTNEIHHRTYELEYLAYTWPATPWVNIAGYNGGRYRLFLFGGTWACFGISGLGCKVGLAIHRQAVPTLKSRNTVVRLSARCRDTNTIPLY